MSDEEDQDIVRLQRAVESLGEHFDTVQIFVTRYEPDESGGGTINVNWGSGNWFARKGQVDNWIMKENERIRREVKDDT